MPYKEIGTTIDPTTFREISIDSYYFPGSFGGIYAYQSMASTTTVNLDAIDLNTVKTQLEATGLITVQYLQMSWNESGGTITDFVLGMVYFVRQPTYGGAVRDHLPADLKQAVIDLKMIERPDFKFYLDELRSLAYHFTWTEKFTADPYMINANESPPADNVLTQEFITEGKVEDALRAFTEKTASEGYVTIIQTYRVHATTKDLGVIGTVQTGFKHRYQSDVTLEVDFDCDRPITTSPIAPVIIAAIAIAIMVIASAFGAAIILWFNNVSSYDSKVTTRITNPSSESVTVHTPQGDVTIPPGGEYDYTEDTSGGGAKKKAKEAITGPLGMWKFPLINWLRGLVSTS